MAVPRGGRAAAARVEPRARRGGKPQPDELARELDQPQRRTRAKAGDRSTLTGLDNAFVNTTRTGSDRVVLVREGEQLPSDVTPEELDRLEGLGAFGEHPRVDAGRRMDALIRAGLAANIAPPERSDEEEHAGEDRSDEDDDTDEDKLPEESGA